MELDLKCQNENTYMKKYLFNLKTQRADGLTLKINHSYSNSSGQIKKYRFINASFNDSGTCLALADHRGYVFIIDLEMGKHWLLPHIGPTTFISYAVTKKQELLIGLDTCSIVICHTETGNINNILSGHTVPAIDASYTDDGYYCLTFCVTEAIVWDLSSHAQIHRLTLKAEASLKKVVFMPVTNNIIACFQDDTLSVWQFGNFECIKQIIPETWKTYHLRDIALTKDGRAMVIGGHSPNLVVFCLDTWTIKKVIEFPENVSGIKQLQFVPQVFDGGANKILAILTTSLEIYFFDIETSTFLSGMHLMFGITSKLTISNNGKYLATIFTTGEVNIYTLERILINNHNLEDGFYTNHTSSRHDFTLPTGCSSNMSKKIQKSNQSLIDIKQQLTEILDLKKIQPILKQFGEYPELYRILIWKTILKLPENQEAFCSLSTKECHPSYNSIELKYPLVNKSLRNSLKKLLSNLSHWCPLFGAVNFLPEFVFPFVKLFHSDPLGCFEVIATILVNWCQNWFEFYPFPPINMLCALENILGYHDPELLEFYFKNDITSSVTMCPLFHSAFSEVLSKSEWLKLWDHILSNEPSYLFMAIVAYNVLCRNAIKSLKNAEDIEKFFHSQNPIDIKRLISKTYFYQRETPEEIHCNQFFTSFRPLTKGTYSSFSAYPKLIVDSNVEKLQTIRKEEEDILEEQMKALTIKQKLDKKLKSENELGDEERIYRELEDKIRKVIEEEEDRLLNQRQKLRNLKQELRLKELEVLENTRDKALKQRRIKKELELERLIHDISKRKARENSEADLMEEEIRRYYAELLLKKCHLELDLGMIDKEYNARESLEIQRDELNKDLKINEHNSVEHGRHIEIVEKMMSVKKLVGDLEEELIKENMKKESKNLETIELKKLKVKVKALEQQIENLLTENLNSLHEEHDDKPAKFEFKTSHKPMSRESQIVPSVPYLKVQKKQASQKLKNEKCKNVVVTAPKKNLNGRYISRKINLQKKREKSERKNTDSLSGIKENKNGKEEVQSRKSNELKLKSKSTCRQHNDKLENPRGYEFIGDFSRDLISENRRSKDEHKRNEVVTEEKYLKSMDYIVPNRNLVLGDAEYSFQSNSENEIFKMTLNTRKQLIEGTKSRQRLK